MARLQTGSIAGLHLELISDHLDQHKRMTELAPADEEAIRRVLGDALSQIVTVVGEAGRTPSSARTATTNAPHELD